MFACSALPTRIPCAMTTTPDAPQASPALVLQRWNSWVRVYLPETREVRWVDLSEATYEPLPEGAPPAGDDRQAGGRW